MNFNAISTASTELLAAACERKVRSPEHVAEPISHEDVRRFVINDLKKLDDGEQFKKIFG